MLPQRSGPDFAGDTITAITLTINDLEFSQVPILGVTYTQASPNVTITVQGSQAPEPQSALLLAAALLVGMGSHRVWKRRTAV